MKLDSYKQKQQNKNKFQVKQSNKRNFIHVDFFIFPFGGRNIVFVIWESTFSKRCQFRVQMLSMQIPKGLLKSNCALSRFVKV